MRGGPCAGQALGVGDLGVGRRVKMMVRAFYGRIVAYDEGLAGEEGALADALQRNLFRGRDGDPAVLAALASYMRREIAAVDGQNLDDILAGRVAFGAPPANSENVTASRRAE